MRLNIGPTIRRVVRDPPFLRILRSVALLNNEFQLISLKFPELVRTSTWGWGRELLIEYVTTCLTKTV